MGFSDNFYKKVEQKTNVNKDTILSLAKKLQGDNLKNEGVLRDETSNFEVSDEVNEVTISIFFTS